MMMLEYLSAAKFIVLIAWYPARRAASPAMSSRPDLRILSLTNSRTDTKMRWSGG